MHTVKTLIPVLLLLAVISCSKGLPRTPTEAFRMTAAAMEAKDARRLYELMSKPSREQLVRTSKLAEKMNSAQKGSLEQKGVIPASADAGAILKAWLEHDEADPVLAAFRRSVLIVTEKDGEAEIRVDNGIELRFVKEGLYWKFAL